MLPFPRAAVLLVLALLWGCASGGVQPLESPAEQDSKAIAKAVTASDYSAHLDVLALGFKDGTFEVRSPAPRHVLGRGKHTAEVVNLALSRDGSKLATADALGKLALSAIESGELALLPGLLPLDEDGLVGLAWDAAGRRLAVSAGPLIRIVDVETGAERETYLKESLAAVAFSPDGTRLVAAGRKLHFLDARDLRNQEQHGIEDIGSRVTDLRFSRDGRTLGILGLGRVAFFDLASKQTKVVELRFMNPVGLRFASDGRVAIFGRRSLYVGPPGANDIAEQARPTTGELWDVEFRKDDSLLFVGASDDAELATLLDTAVVGGQD